MGFQGSAEDWKQAVSEDDAAMAENPSHDLSNYDSAVAIDPGTNTGIAVCWKDGTLTTRTCDFWDVIKSVGDVKYPTINISMLRKPVYIVESPHKTEWGKAQDNSAMAYNSGQVAREAELLVEGLKRKGLDVIEHDPHSSGNSKWGGGKWDSETAHQIVGEWEGPDNEHTRDALRLLVSYGFAA